MVEHAECKDGKAPKMMGELLNVEVYMSKPKSWSIRAKPPGEPDMP